jgi:chaperone required for assembly of F1-ATPase
MREILNDLENGKYLSDPDPVKRAQFRMRQPLPKRFYKDVSIRSTDEGFGVHLDGKVVRTPGRTPVILATETAAQLVGMEFEAQAEEINPVTMPVTRLVNTAIDGAVADMQAVLEDILRYAATDLLCYRADSPQRLVELQAEAWDPVLDWARAKLGARLFLSEGIVHVQQPRESIAAIGSYLRLREEPFRLTCLHVMTTLVGSALLALAVDSGELAPEDAWSAAHVDEDWNIAQWGEDAEAIRRRTLRHSDMMAAANLLRSLG